MTYNPTTFRHTHLGKLLACNADDGAHFGLPGSTVVREAIQEALDQFLRLSPSDQTEPGFLQKLREVFWGGGKTPLQVDPPDRPKDPTHSRSISRKNDELPPQISIVITAQDLLRLLSPSDRLRIYHAGINLPRTYKDEDWIFELGALDPEEKWLAFQDIANHGRPLVWFAERPNVERWISEAERSGLSKADTLRDRLGLLHYGPHVKLSDRVLPNHLFVLHMSSDVASFAGHWRPCAMDGVDGTRFVVRSGGPGLWGRTVDLETLEFGPTCGTRERVLLRLQKEVFPDEHRKVLFEHLGTVTKARGGSVGVDCDETFLRKVLGDRDLANTVSQIW